MRMDRRQHTLDLLLGIAGSDVLWAIPIIGLDVNDEDTLYVCRIAGDFYSPAIRARASRSRERAWPRILSRACFE
jgi:hypothetical protein